MGTSLPNPSQTRLILTPFVADPFVWSLENLFSIKPGSGYAEVSSYVKDLFIDPNPVAWMAIALVLFFAAFVGILVNRCPAYDQPAPEEPS